MEDASTINGMPPLKRYKLLHPQDLQASPSNPHHCLPAKKRTETHSPQPPTSATTTTSICLPAKKRIWAPLPTSPVKNHPPQPIPIPETTDHDAEDDGVACAVCGSTDGDLTDPIVFCDGCDLMVHASCYGSPLTQSIPEGDWFCLSCERLKDGGEGVNCCCLCPAKGGAVKPTADGRWAHILCALLVPEVFFHDPSLKDVIDCSQVPKRRWSKECCVCGCNRGCAIDCSELKCQLGFHVSCGLESGLSVEYREGKGGCASVVAGFCREHTMIWKKLQLTGKYKIVAREQDLKRKGKN